MTRRWIAPVSTKASTRSGVELLAVAEEHRRGQGRILRPTHLARISFPAVRTRSSHRPRLQHEPRSSRATDSLNFARSWPSTRSPRRFSAWSMSPGLRAATGRSVGQRPEAGRRPRRRARSPRPAGSCGPRPAAIARRRARRAVPRRGGRGYPARRRPSGSGGGGGMSRGDFTVRTSTQIGCAVWRAKWPRSSAAKSSQRQWRQEAAVAAAANRIIVAAKRSLPRRHSSHHAAQAPAAASHHTTSGSGQERSATIPTHTAARTMTSGWYRASRGSETTDAMPGIMAGSGGSDKPSPPTTFGTR